MTFEIELQALVDKYGLDGVEITYKKKVFLNATKTADNPELVRKPPATVLLDEETSEIAVRYAGGGVGRIIT